MDLRDQLIMEFLTTGPMPGLAAEAIGEMEALRGPSSWPDPWEEEWEEA